MLTGIGIGIGFGRSVAAEERKARSIPVPGAVVIAPLTQSWSNYGSAGGEFTRIGAPTLSADGATFDGADDGAYIDTGYSDNFTLVAKTRLIAVTSLYPTIVSAMCIAGGTGGWGLGVRASRKWHIHSIGYTVKDSTISADTVEHVVVLRRTDGVTSMYLDGSFVISRSDGNTGGGRSVLAGTWVSGAFYYPIACQVRNKLIYKSALSDTDLALVEAWAAA
jgi:hypothetical protein